MFTTPRVSLGLPWLPPAFAVLVISLIAPCHATEPPQASASLAHQDSQSTERLLLLANGQVLRGSVTVDGERYVVSTASSELRVPRDSVEHVCRTLNEGYQLKRAAMMAAGARDRFRLIQWCLAQGLLDEAEEELRQAEQAEPNNSRYELLRRRLKLARDPVKPAAPPAPLAEPPVADAQLDILVRTIPASTVEAFSQTVQPLLLKNCAAAGCHGTAPRSDFQLIRLARGVTPSRRVTQRNLHAALAWIDRNEPDKSRILTAAAQAHGNTQHNKFEGTEGPVFRHLAQWVHQVARPGEPARPQTVESADSTLSQSIPEPPGVRSKANLARRNSTARSVGGPIARPQPESAKELSPPPAEGTAPTPASPADPFDPEQFNRRYHPPKDEGESTPPPQSSE
ncbi:MAG: hypothetical protein K8T91_06375 [Planctomycetes bacterium]|nr:hypothetical protein [Planctomycetota bacterium]